MLGIDELKNVDKEQPENQTANTGSSAEPKPEEAEEKAKDDERETIEALKKFAEEDDGSDISLKSIIGGDFLMSKFMIKQVLFVVFCVALMLLYTANRYGSQQDAILIDSLRVHLQDVKYNVLTQSSELMNMTRQSNVEKMLSGTKDSMLHSPILPPYLIRMNDESRPVAAKTFREVLVDSLEQEEQDSTETKAKATDSVRSAAAASDKAKPVEMKTDSQTVKKEGEAKNEVR